MLLTFALHERRRYGRAMKRAAPLLPILSAMTGLLCFGVMDGFMKIAALAVGAYAALFWRNLVGSLIMLPVWLARGNKDGKRGLPGREAMRLHLLRSGVSGVMATLFFYGLARMPVAEAMARSFIAPLLARYLAAVWLGEELSRRAVAGSVLALSGVGLIAAGKFGGTSYNAESVHGLIAILISAVLYAWNLVLQRRQSQLAGPEEISFFQTFFIFCLLGIGAWWFAPVPPAQIWAVLAASAVLSTASLMLLGWAYARAEAQVLVPLEYTAFIWAAIVGWVVFSEPLTWRTLAGVVLIVAGCLIALQRKPAPEAAAERA